MKVEFKSGSKDINDQVATQVLEEPLERSLNLFLSDGVESFRCYDVWGNFSRR